MLNVKANGVGEFVSITDEKITNLSAEDVLNHVRVSASEIKMNFDALFN